MLSSDECTVLGFGLPKRFPAVDNVIHNKRHHSAKRGSQHSNPFRYAPVTPSRRPQARRRA